MSTLRVNNVSDLGLDAVVTDGVVEKGALPSGSVLQVVSTTLTTSVVVSSVSTTPLAVPGLSATITPTSTSSKILVTFSIAGGASSQYTGNDIRLFRDSTQIFRSNNANGSLSFGIGNTSGNFLDSPSTTSATDYNIRVVQQVSTGTSVFINRNDANSSFGESTITLMEIAG